METFAVVNVSENPMLHSYLNFFADLRFQVTVKAFQVMFCSAILF